MVVIQRAAHVIKGAAANLFCIELRESAAELEAQAKERTMDIQHMSHQKLKIAAQRFVAFAENPIQD